MSRLLSCLREQHPDREDVIAALGQIGKGYWNTDRYFDLSYVDGIYSTDVGVILPDFQTSGLVKIRTSNFSKSYGKNKKKIDLTPKNWTVN